VKIDTYYSSNNKKVTPNKHIVIDTSGYKLWWWRSLGRWSARTTTSSRRQRWMRRSSVGGEGRSGCEHAKEKTRSCRATSILVVIINVGPSAADDNDIRYHPRQSIFRYNHYVSFIIVCARVLFQPYSIHRITSNTECPILYHLRPTRSSRLFF